MNAPSSKQAIEQLLEGTGIRINGKNPWDITVHDERAYARWLSQGSLGFGESYMDGWWDCDGLDEMVTRLFRANIDKRIKSWAMLFPYIRARVINLQSKSRAFQIGERHYDIGNDLYQAMLDTRMTYTCGYWKDASTLDKAQEDKLNLVCRKLRLEEGMRVLDIGSGWGSFLKFAAERYGIQGVGVTVSKRQIELANELCKGLPIENRLQDYRDIKGETFDRIVSLGMFEHVGNKNYRPYMQVVHNALADNGLFLLHTIGGDYSKSGSDAWIDKYIFPNSTLPSIAQIGKSIEHLFVMEDWHNFGAYYDKTLMEWMKNVDQSWDQLKDNYNKRFYRMWRFYLLTSAAQFRSRRTQLWQIVMSKRGVDGVYERLS
jgi:cyclopropane-fatty-acyl-phospholipid synthase